MKARVCYTSWQMDCCGDDFGVGDTVTFPVVASDDSDDFDYVENHHGPFSDEIRKISGKVAAIEYEYESSKDNERYRLSGDKTEKFIERENGDTFLGFIVHLDNVAKSKYSEEELNNIYP